MSTDDKSVVIDFLLAGAGLVAVEAVDALLRVGGHLVFMDDGVLKPRMTLSTFSRRPDKVGRRLSRFNARTLPIYKKSGQNKRKSDDNSEEHGTKRHAMSPRRIGSVVCPGARRCTPKRNTG